MTDWIVVGAGLTGATIAERLASRFGQKVLVVERRDHVAGNAHDFRDRDGPAKGLLQHRHGLHLFHTNSARVSTYLSRFTGWRPYEHRALADIDGCLVPLPFNFTAIRAVFDPPLAERLIAALGARYGEGAQVAILALRREEDEVLRRLATFVYERIFLGYTVKQWGLTPEELAPSVTARVPVRVGTDDRYFTDTFQALPSEGYTAMVARMLDQPGIELALSTEFDSVQPRQAAVRVVNTGPIDAHYGYRLGGLPYRSLRFATEIRAGGLALPAGQVNYPDPGVPFTRVTEVRHATGGPAAATALVTEFPEAHEPGRNEPYYPVPRPEYQGLLRRYKAMARADGMVFCGRLGDYKYLNMDQAVGAGLAVAADLGRKMGFAS